MHEDVDLYLPEMEDGLYPEGDVGRVVEEDVDEEEAHDVRRDPVRPVCDEGLFFGCVLAEHRQVLR